MKGKLKKILALITLIMLLLISCSQTLTYAANLYVRRTRFNGTQYYYNSTPIFDYAKDNSSVGDFYCLKGGAHIGNTVNSSGWTYEAGYTSKSLDSFSSVSNFESTTGAILRKTVQFKTTSHKYTDNTKNKSLNAIKWLAKNMYLVSSDTTATERSYMKENINKFIQKYCASDIKSANLSELNDEQFGVIQQFVIWHFLEPANNSNYYLNAIESASDVKKITGFNTDAKAKAGYAVYSALVVSAIEYVNGNYTESMDMNSNNKGIQFTKFENKITPVTGQNNTYVTGIMTTTSKNLEKMTISITGTNTTINNWKILDSSNREILNSSNTNSSTNVVGKLANRTFKIQFTTNAAMTSDSKITFNYNYEYKTGISSYSANVYYKSNKQPILEIKKKISKWGNGKGSKKFNYEKPEINFDLALTKQINTIYRYDESTNKYKEVSVTNRLINRDYTKLSDANTTSKYEMNKEPITVIPGDIIRYEIKVFNEGDTVGYVKQIKDYLPKGLEFLSMTTSTEYGKYNYQNRANITYNEGDGEGTDYNVIRYNFTDNNNLGKQASTTTNKYCFSIFIECKVSNAVTANTTLTNISAITNYGYKNEFGNFVGCTKDDIDRDSIQSNLYNGNNNTYSYSTYLRNIENQTRNKNLSKIDKGLIVEEDDEDFEQVKVGGFDLALRKFISGIRGTDDVNAYVDFGRDPRIYSNTIANFEKGGTTARYCHSKKPLSVKEGDHVIYTIRIFNEGNIAGYAKEITDYLPEYLKLDVNSNINKKDGNLLWSTTTSNGNTVLKTTQLANTLIKPANYEEGFEKVLLVSDQSTSGLADKDKFYADVQLECIVQNVTGKNGTIITNMAEISKYGYNRVKAISTAGVVTTEYKNSSTAGVDIDSQANNVTNLLESKGKAKTGAGYLAYQESQPNPETGKTYKITNAPNGYYNGIEDDDDFENLIVNMDSIDLALRKFISKVSDGVTNTVPESREPKIKSYLNNQTNESIRRLQIFHNAYYYHKKDPIEVHTNDTVTYTLRVYNEGNKDGIVKQLVDYLPAGLELKQEGANGWYTDKNTDGSVKKNADGSTTIRRNVEFAVNASPYGAIGGYTSLFNDETINEQDRFWKDVTVECKVTSNIDDKILVNVAEISDYGYNNENGIYIQANVENIDIDSVQNNVFNQLESENNRLYENISSYYNKRYEIDGLDLYPPINGADDDDDFESIKVVSKHEFDIELEKTDANGARINGTKFEITQYETGNPPATAIESGAVTGTQKKILESTEAINGSVTKTVDEITSNKNYFYKVKEIEGIEGYLNVLADYTILIPAHVDNDGNIELACRYSSSENDTWSPTKGFIILDEYNRKIDETEEVYNNVSVTLDNNKIKISVKNPKINGNYRLQVWKKNESNTSTNEWVSGIKFTVNRIENYVDDNNDGIDDNGKNPTTIINDKPTGSKGYVVKNQIPINGSGVDKYTITEAVDLNNEYIELAEPINVYVKKEQVGEEYEATRNIC